MHEELGGVDEDLVSAVPDGAVPPRALRYRRIIKKVQRGKWEVVEDTLTAQNLSLNRGEDLPQQQEGWP